MKFHVTSAVALFVAAASNPALAQGTTSDGFNRDAHFDGPYVSAFVGWGAQSNDIGDVIGFDNDRDGINDDIVATAGGANAFAPGFCNGEALTTSPAGGCRNDADGLEYGIRAGWDKRMNNVVAGGLIEFHKSESKDGTSAFSITPANYGIVRKLDYAISARARLGYTPGGGALFYVTGGGTYAKLKHRFFTSNGANSFDEQRDGKMVWGWQAGGGAEIMVTDQVSLGLEYLFNRIRDNKYSVEVGRGTAPATNPFLIPSGGTNLAHSNRNFESHSLRAAVGFHF